MKAVFTHEEEIVAAGDEWLARLKEAALSAPRRRARLNLHREMESPVHEMLIAFCRDSLIPPHRHHGKSESFHLVEGRALVVIFTEEGEIAEKIELAPPGGKEPFLYRLDGPRWHTVIPLTEMVVIHETTAGPFRPDAEATPSWVPRDEAALAAFLAALTRVLREEPPP